VKVVPFILFVSLCGNTQIALGQDNILFVYIGTAKGDYDSVLVTTADPYAESSKGLEGRHTKVYYIKQETTDTIRSLFSRCPIVTKSDTAKTPFLKSDTFELLDAYKIIGAAPYPLYIHGRDCFMLFKSTLEHLLWKGPDRREPGSGITMGFPVACNAMSHLIIQCHEEFLHRNQYVPARPKDTFRIPNEPPRITFIYP
jgi:hypothetical protein